MQGVGPPWHGRAYQDASQRQALCWLLPPLLVEEEHLTRAAGGQDQTSGEMHCAFSPHPKREQWEAVRYGGPHFPFPQYSLRGASCGVVGVTVHTAVCLTSASNDSLRGEQQRLKPYLPAALKKQKSRKVYILIFVYLL